MLTRCDGHGVRELFLHQLFDLGNINQVQDSMDPAEGRCVVPSSRSNRIMWAVGIRIAPHPTGSSSRERERSRAMICKVKEIEPG